MDSPRAPLRGDIRLAGVNWTHSVVCFSYLDSLPPPRKASASSLDVSLRSITNAHRLLSTRGLQ